MGQLRKSFSALSAEIDANADFSTSFRQYCERGLAQRKASRPRGPLKRYKQIVRDILKAMANDADLPIERITRFHLAEIRQAVAEKSSINNANFYVKVLRMIFRASVNDGMRPDNPALAVKLLADDNAKESRRPFTQDELSKLRAVLTGEWPLIVMMGEQTGQRLGDIANATHGQWIWPIASGHSFRRRPGAPCGFPS